MYQFNTFLSKKKSKQKGTQKIFRFADFSSANWMRDQNIMPIFQDKAWPRYWAYYQSLIGTPI